MKKTTATIPPLFSHQQEARANTLAELDVSDRCKVIMACGTGKTRIGPEIAIGRNARTVVVYLPSLALMRQTLPDWINAPFVGGSPDILCVCSDSTVVDSDAPVVTATELATEFHKPVTTSSDDVHNFLASPSRHARIVFSTYQSSNVVSAGCPDGFVFDMGLFDEAHRTAGKESAFSGPLLDTHTPIFKRVFMTATPKHFILRKKNKKGAEAKVAFSMDNEKVYGRVAYRLPIREAIKRGIIADYQILITVVDDKTIANQLKVPNSKESIEHIAHAIAIKDAMSKYGVTKIVTFHDSVNDAQQFAANGIIQQELGAPIFHVNGMIPTRDRAGIMQQFAATPQALVTNAKCLTEGVDVPAIDMVVFLHPKKSKIDIIQAIGRALRMPRGRKKTTGYILLPIYVSKIENGGLEKTLNESGFDSIVQVVQALKEQDEVVDAAFRNAAKLAKSKQKSTDLGFVKIAGPTGYLDRLRQAITTQCIEYLVENWWKNYGDLEKFFFKYGHTNISTKQPGLGYWISEQRSKYSSGKLSLDKIHALEQINFIFCPYDELWSNSYKELKCFFEKNSHTNIPARTILGLWCQKQRNNYKNESLPLDKIKLLEQIEFDFLGQQETKWLAMYEKLKSYFSSNGNSDVPINTLLLGQWCSSQRCLYKRGGLSANKIEKFKEINFKFFLIDETWWENFKVLKEYFNEHGHTITPYPSTLSNWCSQQRQKYKQPKYKTKKLSPEQIAALESIGFKWSSK